MFKNLTEITDASIIAVDVCIVGAGAAGLTIAQRLIASGKTVLVVDSGGIGGSDNANLLNLYEDVGCPSKGYEGRHRQFGGSTVKWTGRCARLDRFDFKYRPWIPRSGWVVSEETMSRYYDLAESILGLNCCASPGVSIFKHPIIKSFWNNAAVKPFVWRRPSPFSKWSIKRWFGAVRSANSISFGDLYRGKIKRSKSVTVLSNATMVSMTVSEDGSSVSTILVKSWNYNIAQITAKTFILCASGIENPRILLDAPEALRSCVNQYDNVGRYLGQHPRGKIATIDVDASVATNLQKSFNLFLRPRWRSVVYETGFALTEQAQERFGLLNASAILLYEPSSKSGWAAMKRLARLRPTYRYISSFSQDLKYLISDLPIINIFRRFILGRETIFKKPAISVVIDLEQPPIYDSCIRLSERCDRFGRRLALVDWKISESERLTALYFAEALRQEFKVRNLGNIKICDWLYSKSPIRERDLTGNYHFIGTTRMSAKPEDGVVDANLRVHGSSNLYICGASVFPTGGHANPTLTIVALALRLADHLAEL